LTRTPWLLGLCVFAFSRLCAEIDSSVSPLALFPR
jgi:hypothetical protein